MRWLHSHSRVPSLHPSPEYLGKGKLGFTLMELVLVMLIIALMSAVAAPALIRFAAGREVDNYGRSLVAAARYAREASISEARVYRLNLDEKSGRFWLTADAGGGTFNATGGDYSNPSNPPIGLSMKVQVTSQPNYQLLVNQNVQQTTVQQPTQTIDGQTSGTAGAIVMNVHSQGTAYVEFQPNGRVDPAVIDLTDRQNHHVQIACATPTDRLARVEDVK
jgi:type II secretion system protein H